MDIAGAQAIVPGGADNSCPAAPAGRILPGTGMRYPGAADGAPYAAASSFRGKRREIV